MSSSGIPRRSFLAAIPGSSAALIFPQIAAGMQIDPHLSLYREWLDARREWLELSHTTEDWKHPAMLEAESRADRAEDLMLSVAPTTPEGIAALVAVAWFYAGPTSTDPDEHAEQVKSRECLAMAAIWRACTGKSGYPEI